MTNPLQQVLYEFLITFPSPLVFKAVMKSPIQRVHSGIYRYGGSYASRRSFVPPSCLYIRSVTPELLSPQLNSLDKFVEEPYQLSLISFWHQSYNRDSWKGLL